MLPDNGFERQCEWKRLKVRFSEMALVNGEKWCNCSNGDLISGTWGNLSDSGEMLSGDCG